jgi:pimeloyl-ACP methyl ester carboxylesterase
VRRAVVGICAALLVASTLAGCGGTSARHTAAPSAGAPGIQWEKCNNVQCATLAVPLAPNDPSKGTIDLALVRHRATGDKIGTLLTNPGGPGTAALWIAQNADQEFPKELLQHFDIVAWDPRGVGQSTAVRCDSQLDWFWDIDRSPDSQSEVGQNVVVSKRLARDCETTDAHILPYLSSRNTVLDMDRIRQALGDAQISYLGFSYGTYLGSLYANEFPTHVRAMVLDGAVDPTLSPDAVGEQQAVGFEESLDAFLADCSAKTSCAFHAGGNSAQAYDQLIAQIDAEPLAATVNGESRTLGPGEADIGVGEALYGGREAWPQLAKALAHAAQGDGSDLLQLSDEYTMRQKGGSYTNETAAFYAIGCLDAPSVPSLLDVEKEAARTSKLAPRLGASTVWLGLPCTYWPVKPDGSTAPVHAKGAPPILVLGTTHDPATPFAWARSLASQLDSGHLVALNDEGHTAYGRGSACIDDIVHAYLLHLTVPPAGTVCQPS